MKPNVTIITKNEAKNLEECLNTIPTSWTVIVVDSGSVDNTVEIARTQGATVIKKSWMGFGLQKQYAVDQFEKGWILSIDADERVSKELAVEIENLSSEETDTAYRIPRLSYFKGQVIRHSGWRPDHVIRLFNSNYCCFNQNQVHESIIGFRSLKNLKADLLHYPYNDDDDIKRKAQLYGTLGNAQVKEKGSQQGFVISILKSSWSFFRTYIIRLGFLDKKAGFEIAVMNAKVTFFKYSRRL